MGVHAENFGARLKIKAIAVIRFQRVMSIFEGLIIRCYVFARQKLLVVIIMASQRMLPAGLKSN